MTDQITTRRTALKLQAEAAISAIPLSSPLPTEATAASRAVDVLSFLFLIVFQCVSVIALVLYTPQIGEMGLVVFSIIFVWLGATVIIGACDFYAKKEPRTK
jgi:hypothetical protein